MKCDDCLIFKRVRLGVPRRKRPTLLCPYCGKTYKHKPSFDRHVGPCKQDSRFRIAGSIREVEKLIQFKGGFNAS